MSNIKQVSDVNFDQVILENASQTKVIYFGAPWCGPCKTYGPTFSDMATSEEFSNVEFIKINVDECDKSQDKFKIRSIPTTIIFRNDTILASEIGALSQEDLSVLIKNYL
jgi:thioredoxin 1